MGDNQQQQNNESGHLDSDVINEAKTLGWVPKEQFKGRDTEWVDADEFVRRGREILPIVKKDKEKLLQEVSRLKNELQEIRTTSQEFYDYAYKAAEREWKAKYDALLNAKKKAVTDGDGDTLIQVEEAIDEHKEAKPVKPKEEKKTEEKSASGSDPMFDAWRAENSWYDSDPKLKIQANMAGASLAAQGVQGDELYREVTKLVKQMNPDKFPDDVDAERERGGGSTNSRRSSSNSATRTSDRKTYQNLPLEAKEACERFIKNGLYKNLTPEQARQKYVENYDWSA